MGGFKFRRQEAIGPYIVDFVSFESKLIIEVDGGQHAGIKARAQDETRSMWLSGRGYQVLRFWNNDVLLSREAVAESIRAVLERDNAPSPQPSPVKGEGAEAQTYRPETSVSGNAMGTGDVTSGDAAILPPLAGGS